MYLTFPRNSDKLIYIPKNPYENEELIKFQNIPLTKLDFIILNFLGAKDGWVRVDKKTNIWKIYNTILKNKREKTRKMVMYEGESIEDFAKDIAKQANLDITKILKKYKEIAYYKEGDIIAKKYDIPYKTTESSTIAYMVSTSHKIFRDILKKYNYKIKVPSKKFKELLTIASIIEKETQNYSEMPLISAVIHNRLERNMKLQLDATLNYGKHRHSIITPQIIKNDNSQYNTYKFKGLPPQPLGAVSIKAFTAAINPAKVDFLYFVKKGKRHIFSKDYSNHIINVSKYKKRLREKMKRRVYKILNAWVKVEFPMLYPKFNFYLPIK